MKASIYTDDRSVPAEEIWDREVSGSGVWQTNRGFYHSDRYFIDCVKAGKRPHCDFADGLKTIEYCHKILQSDNKTLALRA